MMAGAAHLVFGIGIAFGAGITAIHLLRVTPRIFSVLPPRPAAALHQAVSRRCHAIGVLFALVAAAGAVFDRRASIALVPRLLAVAVLIALHLAGRRLLPLEKKLRERIAALGAGGKADAEIRRFDRVHWTYLSLEGLALLVGLVLLTASVEP
jgi:hypothetical protein